MPHTMTAVVNLAFVIEKKKPHTFCAMWKLAKDKTCNVNPFANGFVSTI